MAQPTTPLGRAVAALRAKSDSYTKLIGYYDGDQPLVYTAKRLEEIFKGVDAYFAQNWCAVVIDSVLERIALDGLVGPDDGVSAKLKELWQTSDLRLESDTVHEYALVCGEGFVVAWPDDDGIPQAFANDPRLCHVFYEPANPRRKEFAAKWWVGTDERYRLTLYFREQLEYYVASKKGSPESDRSFEPSDEFGAPVAPNPYGVIPVFHFRPAGRRVRSDIKNVIPIQNGINKLLADMMVAAEFGAFKQRWVISNVDSKGKLKNAPNEVWEIPSGDGAGQGTSVGQFDSTDLDNYLQAIEKSANALAAITRTPRHFFFGEGGDPSGEALIAMESPLNAKVQDRIDRFSPEWQRLAAFLLQVGGVTVDPSAVTLNWAQIATVQPRTEAEITGLRVTAGIPLESALKLEGYSDEQVAEIMAARDAEMGRQQRSLSDALLAKQREFNEQ